MSNSIKNIIWLASYPKSGNTWFRIILDNLNSDSESPTNINKLTSIPIASSREIFDHYCGLNSSDLNINEINELRPEVYRNIARESENNVFLKIHDAWQLNKTGKEIFPKDVTKSVIYLIRNPLDISVSFAFHQCVSIKESIRILGQKHYILCNNSSKLYPQLDQELLSWSNHVKSWTENSKLPMHIIRYEDLIDNTSLAVKNALSFLNIIKTTQEIESAINNSAFEKLKEQEIEHGFNEKTLNSRAFFRAGKSNSWKDYLDADDIAKIRSDHYHIMDKYGYI